MIPVQLLSNEELTSLMRTILIKKFEIVNKIESGNFQSEFRILMIQFNAINEQIEVIRAEAYRRYTEHL